MSNASKLIVHLNSCTPKRANFAICELHSVKLTSRKRRRRNERSNVKKKKKALYKPHKTEMFPFDMTLGILQGTGAEGQGRQKPGC